MSLIDNNTNYIHNILDILIDNVLDVYNIIMYIYKCIRILTIFFVGNLEVVVRFVHCGLGLTSSKKILSK